MAQQCHFYGLFPIIKKFKLIIIIFYYKNVDLNELERKVGFSVTEKEKDGRKRKKKKREELQSSTWRIRQTPTPT